MRLQIQVAKIYILHELRHLEGVKSALHHIESSQLRWSGHLIMMYS